jgi:hypothetical protein
MGLNMTPQSAQDTQRRIRHIRAEQEALLDLRSMRPEAAWARSLMIQHECLSLELAQLQRSLQEMPRLQRAATKYKPHVPLPDTYGQGKRPIHAKDLLTYIHIPFNPEMYPTQRLKYVWSKIRQYGREHDFSEQQYLTALGIALSGQPFETLQNNIRRGESLATTINDLMTLYEQDDSYRDHSRAIELFAREPRESITRAICRYRHLMDNIQQDYTPSTWPEVLRHRCIETLKHNVSDATHRHILQEEYRILATGEIPSLEHYLQWAEEHEFIFGSTPQIHTEEQDQEPTETLSIPITHVHIPQRGINPRLVYIPVRISSTRASTPHAGLDIMALHDSGCAQSVIRTSKLQELSRQGWPVSIQKPRHQLEVVTAAGATHKPDGLARIRLTFTSSTGAQMSFTHTVVVYADLSQDFLLGRDFTGSTAKLVETNDRMYLSESLGSNPDTPLSTLVQRNEVCEIPLVTTSGFQPKYVASNNMELRIPPNSRTTATYTTQESLTGKYMQPLENTFTRANHVQADVTYTSSDVKAGPRMSTLAQTQLVEPNSVEIYNIQVLAENERVIQELLADPTEELFPDFIKNDQGLNDSEKQAAFTDFLKHGYHHPSMTKIIEDKAALTEMSLKNKTPMTFQEFLESFKISHLPSHIQKLALKTFAQNRGAFSSHPFDLGKAKGIQMKIPINTDKPHIQKYIPIPQAARPQVREIIDQYVEGNILRECNEPSLFCSNILVVKKKDGSIRFLLDGRILNESTQRLPMNLVTPMEVMAQLSGKQWVTTIDLSDAFYQMELHPDSQPYTAFYSEAHGKRYCFTRCPQGLKNSPLHLKLLMDQLFGDMYGIVIHYADDIMIATDDSLEHHIQQVGEVLRRLSEGNIKIRPHKVNIARDTIEFLGVTWKKGQINIPEARVLAFREIPIPDTPKKLKSVLCALSYYRRFVPRFATLTQELMDLTTLHPKQFKLTDTQKEQFTTLIDTMCKNTVLYLPDPDKPYYVQTDASQFCGAGKVFQKGDDGSEQLLACISRTFTKAEQRYSTIKKEVLALLYTLRAMDFFLRFANKIVILIDARSIVYLRMCKDSAGILLRFSLELSKYNAEVQHVPGIQNEVADVLSRQHRNIDQIVSENKDHPILSEKQTVEWLDRLSMPKTYHFTPEQVADMLDTPSLPDPTAVRPKRASKSKPGTVNIRNIPATLHNRKVKMPKEVTRAPGAKLPPGIRPQIPCNNITFTHQDFQTITRTILAGILTPQQFKEAQDQDETCQDILARLPSQPNFQVFQGILFHKSNDTEYQLVLPESLLDGLINTKHYSVYGIHYAASRIHRDIRAKFYVPTAVLTARIRKLTASCFLCNINQTGLKDQELAEIPIIQAPRTTWSIDIIPNMPETDNGNHKAILAVDTFTGYIQICPLADKTSKSLLQAIDQMIIRPFGVPKYLRSDNEISLWNSTEFYNYLQPLGVTFIPTSVASPWSNGHAERAIRTIKEGLRKFLLQEHIVPQWDQYISLFVQAHNQSVSVFGHSPESLMFGFEKPTAVDLLQLWPNAADPQQYMETITTIAEQRRAETARRRSEHGHRNRTFKNQARVRKEFMRGDIVACRQLQVSTGPNSSLKPRHTGPYAVLQVDKDNLSCIVEDLLTGHESREHFTNLIHLSFDPETHRIHGNFEDDLQRMAHDIRTNRIPIRPDLRRQPRTPASQQGSQQTPDDTESTAATASQQGPSTSRQTQTGRILRQ